MIGRQVGRPPPPLPKRTVIGPSSFGVAVMLMV
jgi:hypothetical protein